MSVHGSRRIVEMPDYEDDFPDRMEPAYILLEDQGSGAVAFGCVTGQIFGGGDTDAVEFHWSGEDEMDEAQGHGWAEILPDGSLVGQIRFHGGDEANFIARRWTSSTACQSFRRPTIAPSSSPCSPVRWLAPSLRCSRPPSTTPRPAESSDGQSAGPRRYSISWP